LAPRNATVTVLRGRPVDEFVGEPLMIPFAMIMGDELRNGVSEVALPKRNHATETFLFDRAHEAFGVALQ
jgi:hypothetical protein